MVGERYASAWEEMIRKKGRLAAFRAMWEQVKAVHAAAGVPESDMTEPNWHKCVFAYWPSGSHKWKVGVDVPKAIGLVADGHSDKSGVYIIGDAFSTLQGWVQGAVDTADVAIGNMMKQFPKDLTA